MQEGNREIIYHIRQHGYLCQSSSGADQVLHGQSVNEYIYENEHKDITFIFKFRSTLLTCDARFNFSDKNCNY